MNRLQDFARRLAAVLSSMKLTVVCLALLMILTVTCTLMQVPLGTHIAVERTIRSFLIWWTPEGSSYRYPIFPGGGLVGLVLLLNLLFAQFMKLERSRRKLGMWLAHIGLALLFLGEFSTAMLQVESQMPIEVNQTVNFTEDVRSLELAVTDVTNPAEAAGTAIPDSYFHRHQVHHPSLPFTLDFKKYYLNSELGMRKAGDPPSEANGGIGANLAVRPIPIVTADDAQNSSALLMEAFADDGKSLGRFWISNALGAPQGFTRNSHTYRFALRPRRYYLGYSMTLKEFKHDIYPGTDIPKNFSSLVRLQDPRSGEDRDVLIYMNHPLRYAGKTFYQASFGKDDRLSIFQVVRNPGWLIPYLSCLMVAIGLLLHFGQRLSVSLRGAK